jgi:hypothetical protein
MCATHVRSACGVEIEQSPRSKAICDRKSPAVLRELCPPWFVAFVMSAQCSLQVAADNNNWAVPPWVSQKAPRANSLALSLDRGYGGTTRVPLVDVGSLARQVDSFARSTHTTRHRSVASALESRALMVWLAHLRLVCCYIDRCLAWSALGAERHYYQRPLPPGHQPGHPGFCLCQVRGGSYTSKMTSSNAASCAYGSPIGLHIITAPSAVCR